MILNIPAMKQNTPFRTKNTGIFSIFLIVFTFFTLNAVAMFQDPVNSHTEFKGKIVDTRTGNAIPSAFLSINGTNISTVSNNEGQFSLKVPNKYLDSTLSVSVMGYKSKMLELNSIPKNNNVIMLNESIEELSEVSLFSATNAKKLIYDVLDKKEENYFSKPMQMTAFYRESIKKRRRNVSLAEAVVSIYKKPYSTRADDEIAIIKARKSADYERLDTLAIKFRGGPYNTLYIDIMKYPERMLNQSQLDNFQFSFDEPAKINDRYLYVVNFEELDKSSPWYFGKLYVDAESLTLVKASFNLNLDNKRLASKMFVKKKPNGTDVRPVEVHYEINYRERDGKWSYGYGSATMELVVDWKRKLFNSRYTIKSEMAVTDWKMIPEGAEYKNGKFIDDKVVMSDDVSGFADTSFWGDNNIIEPDKSIQNAIDKIQQKMNFE